MCLVNLSTPLTTVLTISSAATSCPSVKLSHDDQRAAQSEKCRTCDRLQKQRPRSVCAKSKVLSARDHVIDQQFVGALGRKPQTKTRAQRQCVVAHFQKPVGDVVFGA